MVKLHSLKLFIAAAKNRSFTSAAKEQFTSSTSIVHAVNQLEDHYGISLFVRRKSRGLELTNDGKELLKKAKILINEAEALETTFGSQKQGIRGELVVGCQEGLTWSLMPRVISKLAKKYPDLKIIMKTTWMEEKFLSLESGEIDALVTFVLEPINTQLFDYSLLCEPTACALMRAGHPLDSESGVTLEQLAKYPQIMINDGAGYTIFSEMYSKVGLKPKIMLMSNISTGAQSIAGRTDAVSLRILRPAHNLSPLGDPISFPKLLDDTTKPSLVVVSNKLRLAGANTKYEVFKNELKEVFDNQEMKKHIIY